MKEKKHTVLIVEDDEPQRLLARLCFESLGTPFKVQLAANGAEAISYLKGEGKFADRSKFEFPSYIVTDLQMDPGDGFHILEFLKAHPALSVVPVVVLSNSDDPDDVRQAYLLGASSFLVKPCSVDAFKSLLRTIHDYWAQCQVPEVDTAGYAVPTDSFGRLGARYKKPER